RTLRKGTVLDVPRQYLRTPMAALRTSRGETCILTEPGRNRIRSIFEEMPNLAPEEYGTRTADYSGFTERCSTG
ncbi:MAG: hypothetical protein ABGY42_13840, partial [bacterium]